MENMESKVSEMSDIQNNVLGNVNNSTFLTEDIGYETRAFSNYIEEDMSSKMDHLMHSDTMILVAGLVVMILLGLVFRSICLRLSSKNNRKELVRGGLKEMAKHMDHVTRAMSNDLELPNSPKTVIRTYSSYGVKGQSVEDESDKNGPIRNSLRVQAFTNILKIEMDNQENNNHDCDTSLEMGSIECKDR